MIRTLLALPLLVLLVLFALSNPQPITLGMWPTDFTWTVPLSIAMLILMAVAFVIGGLLLWFNAIGARARAARADRALRRLERENRDLQARLETATNAAAIQARRSTLLPPPPTLAPALTAPALPRV